MQDEETFPVTLNREHPVDTRERKILKIEAQRLIDLHLNHLRVSKELWQWHHRKRDCVLDVGNGH